MYQYNDEALKSIDQRKQAIGHIETALQLLTGTVAPTPEDADKLSDLIGRLRPYALTQEIVDSMRARGISHDF